MIADTKRDLLRAIKYFLDDAIVLPPGQLEDPNLLKSIQEKVSLSNGNKHTLSQLLMIRSFSIPSVWRYAC